MEWNKRVGVWAEDLQSDLLLAQPQLSGLGLTPPPAGLASDGPRGSCYNKAGGRQT